MTRETALTGFEDHQIRRVYDEKRDVWYFSVVDIMAVLAAQSDYQTARKYRNKLKERLRKEGSESVTNCHQLKMIAEDGKKRLTDVADPETLLRLIQSVPTPGAPRPMTSPASGPFVTPMAAWLSTRSQAKMPFKADLSPLAPCSMIFRVDICCGSYVSYFFLRDVASEMSGEGTRRVVMEPEMMDCYLYAAHSIHTEPKPSIHFQAKMSKWQAPTPKVNQ